MRTPYLPPRRLVFSGGGIRVVSQLGVLQYLQENQLLHQVRELCGVSAGSLVSLMMALGYRLEVLEKFCLQQNFSELSSFEPEHAFLFLEHQGVDNGEKLKHLLEKILYHKGFPPTATFLDLKKAGCKSLRVWASDIQHVKPVEFSAKKTPNLSVVFAIQASMAFPFQYLPLRHPETDTMLLDGGVFDNYPISHLTQEEAEESLGMTFAFGATPQKIEQFTDFLSLITTGQYMPSQQKLIQRHKHRTIVIPCADVPALDFEASPEKRQRLIVLGRKAAEEFFNSLPRWEGRRHSIS